MAARSLQFWPPGALPAGRLAARRWPRCPLADSMGGEGLAVRQKVTGAPNPLKKRKRQNGPNDSRLEKK